MRASRRGRGRPSLAAQAGVSPHLVYGRGPTLPRAASSPEADLAWALHSARAIEAPMTSSLDHLPKGKRRELASVVDAIRVGFAFAIAGRTTPASRGRAPLQDHPVRQLCPWRQRRASGRPASSRASAAPWTREKGSRGDSHLAWGRLSSSHIACYLACYLLILTGGEGAAKCLKRWWTH